ncbi:MAG: glycosyl hydrolase [Chloroflexi bacterium]|nr:glycosyl hydrolase [Chloroflexota bacterium]
MKWISTSPTATWHEQTPQPTLASPQLTIIDHRRQTIDGFGGCFNEIGWQALQALPEDCRQQVLRSLFDSATGCGFRLGRVPIGASDFALEWYSHNEHANDMAMEHFSITHDERYLLPYIRAALSVQPDLCLFASPWSPPTWMKQPCVYNGGMLRWEPEILAAYTLYLRRFVEAYQAAGISIQQLHVQNEPDSSQPFPSCLWTGAKLRDFIRDYLGPHFHAANLACEIWVGTLERPDYDAWAYTILRDPDARAYVSGVGYQWAGKGAVQRTHQSWPDLRLLQTENECGDGTNTWEYAHYVFSLLHHYLSNGVNGYLYWNMALPPGGLSTWGWAQNSLITVDPSQATVTYNPEFYVMKHVSRWVVPGSKRIELAGPWRGNALAFETPIGATVVVLNNPFTEPIELIVDVAGNRNLLPLEAQSFNTLLLSE